jgi:hypothetical protein
MTETTAVCIRGCTTRNRHTTTCPNPNTCQGCLPRPAKHGHLCYPCHARMRQWFQQAPTIHAWLTANMAAGQGAAPETDRITGSREQPTPIKLGILDTRDLLATQLAELVGELRETHHLTAPTQHGIGPDARFLLTWQPTLERHDWVRDWWDTLAETMGQAHALAPWRAELRRCPGVACPECEETNLVIYGGDVDVSCQSCRTMIAPERYAIWTRMLAEGVGA